MKKSLWKKRIIALFTVLALIASIVFYVKLTVKAKINETEVYVTKSDIPPRTEITKDMVEKIVVPVQGIPSDAVRSEKDIVGKWTVAGYGIPSHSFIYKDKIVNKNEMPDSGILELQKNEVAFPLLVDLETSLGNSIIPDSKVDLYFKSSIKDNDKSKAIYGKLASQVRVVSVKDADASNVFDPEGYKQGEEQTSAINKNNKSLAKIYIFAVPRELNDLINKAKLVGDIVPIATGHSYDAETKTEAGQNEVIKYIEDSSYKSKE
ncbi:hypothetical protein G3M81_22965 [Bacillus paralicheniformis]|jgi:pilus assembly protein CpaB|uniref:SAF domain-containing protein n=1 Tax=Bacillus TaxID=1386 RepID=UPI0013EEB8E5|nr:MULTISPECIES: SAF domain-containing protein [Bacillus]QII26953.1 hypothetical protein G3M80_20875 [Bacillus altitudinis]QII51421.1 hypothetical protein G3M81_22965 [Bacillus paralicheniformis]